MMCDYCIYLSFDSTVVLTNNFFPIHFSIVLDCPLGHYQCGDIALVGIDHERARGGRRFLLHIKKVHRNYI